MKSVKLSRALVEVSRHFLNDIMGMGNSCVLNKQFANVCPVGAFQSLSGSSCSSHNFFWLYQAGAGCSDVWGRYFPVLLLSLFPYHKNLYKSPV